MHLSSTNHPLVDVADHSRDHLCPRRNQECWKRPHSFVVPFLLSLAQVPHRSSQHHTCIRGGLSCDRGPPPSEFPSSGKRGHSTARRSYSPECPPRQQELNSTKEDDKKKLVEYNVKSSKSKFISFSLLSPQKLRPPPKKYICVQNCSMLALLTIVAAKSHPWVILFDWHYTTVDARKEPRIRPKRLFGKERS